MAAVAYDVVLLMYELLFDMCNAVLMFVSSAGCSWVRRRAGGAQLWIDRRLIWPADAATQQRKHP